MLARELKLVPFTFSEGLVNCVFIFGVLVEFPIWCNVSCICGKDILKKGYLEWELYIWILGCLAIMFCTGGNLPLSPLLVHGILVNNPMHSLPLVFWS